MIRLGDAPTDLLFALIAVNNNVVAPELIPGALRSLEATQSLAEILVTQGMLTSTQRDLVETLVGEYVARNGGDAEKSLATLMATPSAQKLLHQLDDTELTESLAYSASLGSTASIDLDDPERTLLPPRKIAVDSKPRIAGFEILEVLGAGGMGIVYRARQERLDRFVALKMIRAGADARPEDLLRFETEAKAVAAIEHSNIVKIFEIGEQDGLPYFSLEYLAGGSLAKKISGKPQPVDEAARIVEILARATAVAHQHGVIHRDLKPANVLIAADGTLKITDFGLVKRLESDSGQTRSGSILGTPSYMAPEQARAESQHVGPAADQYSLGAILYELLTGRPPFQGSSVLDTLDMVRSKEPVAPSQLQPRTPPDLETICLKCLEKDIARRYPDVLALAEDLRRFRAGEHILARPVSDIERLWRWCLRNRRVALLTATVAMLLVVVAAGSAVAAVMLGKANSTAEKRRQEAETKTALAVSAARAANEQNRIAVEAQVELVKLLDGDLRYVPEIQQSREQLIDKAVKRLTDAAKAMTDLRRDVDWDPKDEVNNWKSLARSYQAQARVSISRNKIQDAIKQYQQLEQIIQRLAANDPADVNMQLNLMRTQREIGKTSMSDVGDSELAKRYIDRALDLSLECLAKNPDLDLYKIELANSLGMLAAWELRLGHLNEAREQYQKEIAARESVSPSMAHEWETRRELAALHAQLAELNVRMGDQTEARRLYEKSAKLRKEVAADKERDGNNFPISRWLWNSSVVPFGQNFVEHDLHGLLEPYGILSACFVGLV
jgi:serine/threonine-protein kinase